MNQIEDNLIYKIRKNIVKISILSQKDEVDLNFYCYKPFK